MLKFRVLLRVNFRPNFTISHAYFLFIFLLAASFTSFAHDGYDLWLRYTPINASDAARYRNSISGWTLTSQSSTANVIRAELTRALPVLLGKGIGELKGINTQHQ